ncbi:MAG: hypothetical protein O7B99_02730, partial [Planctomycetota bacterium]|nr:hypothetical protein [Planctomycetota bacterium]
LLQEALPAPIYLVCATPSAMEDLLLFVDLFLGLERLAPLNVATFDRSGEARLLVGEPGEYLVELEAKLRSSDNYRVTSVTGHDPIEIVVLDTPAEQTFPIDVSGVDFAKTLEYLSGD